MNVGASLVKQVASATNDVAGDGTTTATVLARAIFAEVRPCTVPAYLPACLIAIVAEMRPRCTPGTPCIASGRQAP